MIGIDVGGANVKVADMDGVHTVYCPLWEGSPLKEILLKFHRPGMDEAAVVMSGELADCFSTKMEGISWITDGVREVFPGARFYGTDGQFHDRPDPILAAANWLASADYLRKYYPSGLLVDMGSTTTDIIPLTDFSSLLGLTDLARLQKGYLVYTGLLRTTLPAVLRTVTLNGTPTPVSSEYFAASADAHLVLGNLREEDYTCDTPDRKGKDRISCLRRLARVVCADLDEIGESGAVQVARSFRDEQDSMIGAAASRAARESGAERIITAGIGSALMARALNGHDLSADIGSATSALPSFAVREVMRRGDWH